MRAPLVPANEAERIQVLRDLLILDSPPEDHFDNITAYCQSRFGTEIVLVTLVDSDRQWFKSAVGLQTKETPREISFCGHTILQDEVMIVSDASRDERFADNPLVTGPPYIHFYAGAPLKLTSGYTVGTLCLIDSKPKHLEPEEIEHLKVLAKMVAIELERPRSREECHKSIPPAVPDT